MVSFFCSYNIILKCLFLQVFFAWERPHCCAAAQGLSEALVFVSAEEAELVDTELAIAASLALRLPEVPTDTDRGNNRDPYRYQSVENSHFGLLVPEKPSQG